MRGDSVFKYKGTWGTMSTVVADEGTIGLWKGNFANVLRVIPVYALKFAFNDTFKAMVAGDSKKRLNFQELMLSGTLAVRDLGEEVDSQRISPIGMLAGAVSINRDIPIGGCSHSPFCWRRPWLTLSEHLALCH